MGATSSSPLDRLKQPEYIGENRCIPCTTVNVAIAVALAVAIAVVTPLVADAVVGLSLAGGVFVLSLAAIYFRGYLVPGTPTLTKRYFPEWLLAKFDKEPLEPEFEDEAEFDGEATLEQMREAPDDEPPENVNPDEWLLEHEVLVPCDDVDDLCFPDDVRAEFAEHVDRLREQERTAQVAPFLELEPDEIELKETHRIAFYVNDHIVARWRSEGPMLADLAAARTLEGWIDDWNRLTLRQRSKVVSALRPFVEECPLCSEPVTIQEKTVSTCCRERTHYAVACEGCEETLMKINQNLT